MTARTRPLLAALLVVALTTALFPVTASAGTVEKHGNVPDWWSELIPIDEAEWFDFPCDTGGYAWETYYKQFGGEYPDCGEMRDAFYGDPLFPPPPGSDLWPDYSDLAAYRIEMRGGFVGQEMTVNHRWGEGVDDWDTVGTCVGEAGKTCVWEQVVRDGDILSMNVAYCGAGNPIEPNCSLETYGVLMMWLGENQLGDDPDHPGTRPGVPPHPQEVIDSVDQDKIRDALGVGDPLSPNTRFVDVPEDHTFYGDVEWLADSGITKGCDTDRFCPDQPVTRGQMAAFLTRALGLEKGSASFADTAGHTFEADVAALAEAGITKGCDTDRFCPDQPVTRGQMAAFLTRALGLEKGSASFTDTAGHTFEADVAALAEAGITKGCGPDKFCPDEPVTREQMAAFLARALR